MSFIHYEPSCIHTDIELSKFESGEEKAFGAEALNHLYTQIPPEFMQVHSFKPTRKRLVFL